MSDAAGPSSFDSARLKAPSATLRVHTYQSPLAKQLANGPAAAGYAMVHSNEFDSYTGIHIQLGLPSANCAGIHDFGV